MSSKALKEQKRLKLEELKLARAGGGKRDYKPTEAEAIYDEVDDLDYKVIVKGRLQEDDFIEEDDGVSGYADNGMEDWDRSDDSAEERDTRKKAKKSAAADAAKAATAKPPSKAALTAARRKAARPVIAPGANPYLDPTRKKTGMGAPLPEQEDDFMANLLGGLEGKATVRTDEVRKAAPVAARYSLGGGGMKKRRAEEDKSSDASDFMSSDAPSRAGPSSDSMEHASSALGSAKKVRIDVVEEEFDFGDIGNGGGGPDSEGEDVKMFDATKDEDDDDDELFVKPSLLDSTKPKGPAVRRQLVNSIKLVAPKPEPVVDEIPPEVIQPIVSSKPKGMDWRTATAALASAPLSIDDLEQEDDKMGEEVDVLPTPLSLVTGKRGPPPITVKHVTATEPDGSLNFWWFDYIEPQGGSGQIFLIGKVKVTDGPEKGKWVSAVVGVQGIRRKLYVLPRNCTLDDEGEVLDEDPPEYDAVAGNFETDASERWGAKNVQIAPDFVQRKYAFGIQGIPRESTDWLEVYTDFPGAKGDIPLDASGETYTHVFGTNSTAFELFVVERKILGPCWLKMEAGQFKAAVDPTSAISWTRLEVEVMHGNIRTFDQKEENRPIANPPLTIMSLSVRTVVHVAENKREIVCVSARTYTDANIDDPTPIERQPSSVVTLVRSLHTPFPDDFAQAARTAKPTPKGRGAEAPIQLFGTEKELLEKLLEMMLKRDPDVIVGCDFVKQGADLDIILVRLRDLKVDHWSRIGRLRRPKMPVIKQGYTSQFLSGRLICDLTTEASKAIIDSVTWSLTEMCGTHLKIDREEIDQEDVPTFFDAEFTSSARLLHFLMLCEADAYFQMAIAYKVQALPLSRQLTNLAGNSWNKTLAGNRAERNDYILLHRFNENGYVCPDKISRDQKKADELKLAKAKGKGKGKAMHVDEDEPEIVMTKAKFKGGLVFDPKKGLWDRFILVMDFNSLYPSIIQEYDIDFSTIDWTVDNADDVESMPERGPCDGAPQGILPQLIAFLVERRKNVKGLMKGLAKDKSSASAAKLLQYDITQKALKLTANSMYGCLGYEGSRFYARPLAALVTFKGREILTRTKADAESLGLDVIYGDTDSVMINTNEMDLAAALKIGEDFKKLINEKYKKLEIDTDAVFERMLLLNKKKYAAVSVGDDGTRSTEVKGLDMKRREYCELSKDASKYVLSQILSGEATEIVVEQIHEYLTTLSANVRGGRIPIDQFIINKRLGKDPEKYPDAKSLAHVQVAIKMKAKGVSAKEGDMIPFMFCTPEDPTVKGGKASNAYHKDDVRRNGSTLKVDFEYYLANQVLPSIERLCEHIEGTEKARLAECLGLDVQRYRGATEITEREFTTLQSQVTDAQRFANTEPLRIRCRACHTESIFDGLAENSAGIINSAGMFCADIECSQPLATASIAVQLDLMIRSFIIKFYEQWLICDDTSCGNRTRMMSVYGKRCLSAGCRGQMHAEYSDSKLYNQLLYFDSLFDTEKVRANVAGTSRSEEVQNCLEGNKAAFVELRAVVHKHLEKNGRRWVNMSSLFSYLK